jgi:hypothetical protein
LCLFTYYRTQDSFYLFSRFTDTSWTFIHVNGQLHNRPCSFYLCHLLNIFHVFQSSRPVKAQYIRMYVGLHVKRFIRYRNVSTQLIKILDTKFPENPSYGSLHCCRCERSKYCTSRSAIFCSSVTSLFAYVDSFCGTSWHIAHCSVFYVHGSVHRGYIYIYIFDCKSDGMHTDFLCILYYLYLSCLFRVLFVPIIRSTNCRVQP